MSNHNDHANLIWQIADLLRGAARESVSISEIVRRAVRSYFAEKNDIAQLKADVQILQSQAQLSATAGAVVMDLKEEIEKLKREK